MSNQPEANCPTLAEIIQPVLEREKERVRKNNQRAQERGQAATLTLRQWLIILHHYQWRCAHCQRIGFQTLDHIIPLADGGGTMATNCVPACEKCNHERSARWQKEQRLVRRLEEVFSLLTKVDG